MSQFQCPECGYRYDEERGEPHQGYAPGTPWNELPEDFACPDCAVRVKADFEEVPNT
ncbi:rubredoxin [Pseudomonas alcaligenes]|uniref:Rubredoxin n=1 Tax=Aquipseudomonas alcaligenes TaxID=43263 RepID=A0ABR7S4B7_AQUAC|nr:rubredoxin [Pseudomonas alcaligenes]MBC9251655.1 rubredoxin [Pseudomonas alcaligenes]